MSNLLLSGEVDFAPITGPDKQRLLAAGLDTLDFPLSGAWLWFNQIGDRPTADSDVRRALVHALDLGEVIKVNTGGNGDASTGIVATGPNPCPRDSDVLGFLPEHDPAAAERLLESAGWGTAPDGGAGERLSNTELAENLVGKLLLVHGEMDHNVTPHLTMRLVNSLIGANKDFDLLIVPNTEHSFHGAAHYVTRRRWDYLVRHLMRREPPEYQLASMPIDPDVVEYLLG